MGIVGAARAAYVVAPDPDDENRKILAATKSNLAPLPGALAYRLVTADWEGAHVPIWEGREAQAGDSGTPRTSFPDLF